MKSSTRRRSVAATARRFSVGLLRRSMAPLARGPPRASPCRCPGRSAAGRARRRPPRRWRPGARKRRGWCPRAGRGRCPPPGRRGRARPTSSPMYSIGASSRSPSPMTTTPWMGKASKARRIASTAAWSERCFSPRPINRAAAMAAISVTRTTSSARLRSIMALPLGTARDELDDVTPEGARACPRW